MKKIILIASVWFAFCCTANAQDSSMLIGTCSSVDIKASDNIIPSINDTIISRGTLDVAKTWTPGSTLRVKFLNGDTAHHNRVMKFAPEWSQYGNIYFQFIEKGIADIRIKFDTTGANNSEIGTDAYIIGQDQATMYLDFDDSTSDAICRRHILHEFGHALGLLHEHSSPLVKINWNYDTLYSYYKKRNNWNKKEVDENVLSTYGKAYSNGQYDEKSIMHYFIPAFLTKDHKSVGGNFELSDGDKQLIAQLYPKTQGASNNDDMPVVPYNILPEPSLSNNNIIIKPIFTLLNGAGYSFRIAAYFFDFNSKPLADVNKTDNRSQDGQLVIFVKIQPCCKNLNFNAAKQNPMLLSLPITSFALKKGVNQLKYKIIIWSGKVCVYKSPMYNLPPLKIA